MIGVLELKEVRETRGVPIALMERTEVLAAVPEVTDVQTGKRSWSTIGGWMVPLIFHTCLPREVTSRCHKC